MASPQSNATTSQSAPGFLAKPPGDCCLKGSLHEGEPRGTFVDVDGLETYISEPADGKANGHILLYFPDVWGMFNNGLLIMDGFADAGFLVLGPDYFRGVRHFPPCVTFEGQGTEDGLGPGLEVSQGPS